MVGNRGLKIMEKNDLIKIWKEGNKEMLKEKKFEKAELEALIRPKIAKAALSLNFNIFLFMAVQITTMALIGIDLYVFRSNPIMLAVLIPMFILSSSFFGYGVFLLNHLHQINQSEQDLVGAITKKLKTYRTHYEVWMWMISVSLVFLVLALNAMTDNVQGTYRINHPWVFAGTIFAMLIFIYGTQKLTQVVSLRTIKAYLNDLLNEALDRTLRIEEDKKKYRVLAVILVIILSALLILGLIKSGIFF